MTIQFDRCAESRKWFTHFSLRSMTCLYVSTTPTCQLTPTEVATVTKSLQQFQLGEGSDGRRLLERGRNYALPKGDPTFVDALSLFIKEEQQHSRYLASFMESQGIPLASKHWVDSTFRRLRGLGGLELSLTVLLTAELIAIAYYRALLNATNSSTLKIICRRILEDEAAHLRFQSSMAARVAWSPQGVVQEVLLTLHLLFLLGTIILVWTQHRAVFKAGGYSFRRFTKETVFEFFAWADSRRILVARWKKDLKPFLAADSSDLFA